MDADAIRRALRRIAHEIIERNPRTRKARARGNSVARRRDCAAHRRHLSRRSKRSRSRPASSMWRCIATMSERARNCPSCARQNFRFRWKGARSSLSMTFFTPAALFARPWTRSVHSDGRPGSNWPLDRSRPSRAANSPRLRRQKFADCYLRREEVRRADLGSRPTASLIARVAEKKKS